MRVGLVRVAVVGALLSIGGAAFADDNGNGGFVWGTITGKRISWGNDLGTKRISWGNDLGTKRISWGNDLGTKRISWGNDLGTKRISWGNDLGTKHISWTGTVLTGNPLAAYGFVWGT